MKTLLAGALGALLNSVCRKRFSVRCKRYLQILMACAFITTQMSSCTSGTSSGLKRPVSPPRGCSQASEISVLPDGARGRYDFVLIEQVDILPEASYGLHKNVADEVIKALYVNLQIQMRKRFALSGSTVQGVPLIVRSRIIQIEEPSPSLNIATSMVMGPVSHGGLGIEVVAVDGANGRTVASFSLCGRAGQREHRESYTHAGHAKALARNFSVSAAELLSPLARRHR